MSDRCRKCGRLNPRVKMGLDTCGCDEMVFKASGRLNPQKIETNKSLKQNNNETIKVQYIPSQPTGSFKMREDMIDKEATKRFLAGENLATILKTKKRGRPREDRTICRKCAEPLAKGSNSYCRLHERERLKEWRKNRENSN